MTLTFLTQRRYGSTLKDISLATESRYIAEHSNFVKPRSLSRHKMNYNQYAISDPKISKSWKDNTRNSNQWGNKVEDPYGKAYFPFRTSSYVYIGESDGSFTKGQTYYCREFGFSFYTGAMGAFMSTDDYMDGDDVDYCCFVSVMEFPQFFNVERCY